MKTFSATHLNKHAQEVFAAVAKDGWVTIKHDRYPENDIILMHRAKPKAERLKELEAERDSLLAEDSSTCEP